jgi:hypothetical protein
MIIALLSLRGEQPETRIYSAHRALRGDVPLSRITQEAKSHA